MASHPARAEARGDRRAEGSAEAPTEGPALPPPGPAASLEAAREAAWRARARRELLYCSTLAVLFTVVVLLAGGIPVVDRPVRDALLAATADKPDPRIVLVTVSDTSLQSVGSWPWGWGSHAKLLAAICAQQPAAVGLDVLLADPQPGNEAAGEALAATMRRCGKVVLPLSAHGSGRAEEVFPLPAFARAAASLGHINLLLAGDGVARELPAQVRAGQRSWTPFPVELLRVAHDRAGAAQGGAPSLLLAPVRGSFEVVAAEAVLQGELPSGTLSGKLVLVGVTASGIGGVHAVPGWGAQRTVPGVELMALALNNQLRPWPVRDAPVAVLVLFNAAVLAGVVSILAFVSPSRVLAASLLLCAGASLGSWALLRQWGLLVNPATGILVGMVVYPLWNWRKLDNLLGYVSAETERLQMTRALDVALPLPQPRNDVESRIHALETTVRQVRSLHRYLRAILQGLPDASLLVDTRGRVVLANIAAARYFCAGAEGALLGRHFDALTRGLHLQTAAGLAIGVADLPRDGALLNLEIRGRDGRELLLRSVAFEEHACDQFHGWIVTLIDVYTLRVLERARDEAFAFISHDMRSPQASILALIEMHRRGGGDGASAEALLPRIERYARDAMALAEDFVLSLRARAAPFAPSVLDLAELCESCVDMLQPQARARQLTLRCVHLPSPEPAFVAGEARLLRRALDNLVGNAIKFSPRGATVTLQIQRAGGFWKISVLDDGPGIEQEQLVTVFDRYYQTERGAKLPSGAGLGLDFVRQVAGRHQGQVCARTRPSGGSEFEMTLHALAMGGDEDQESPAPPRELAQEGRDAEHAEKAMMAGMAGMAGMAQRAKTTKEANEAGLGALL